MNIEDYLRRQMVFSKATFGSEGRINGVINHLEKELEEVKACPTDLEEWIDIITLALDGAWRAGYTPEDITKMLEAKLVKNMKRTWPDWKTHPEDQAIEHVRD